MDQSILYQKQISLTEWFADIDHHLTEEMRKEDNEKRDRLKILQDVIGLPFDAPHQFSATELAEGSERFKVFLADHGHELCALRLIPTDPSLPKLRMRGHTVRDVMQWFKEQKIDPDQYKADFVPHAETPTWSTIFVVNKHGFFGEIIHGGHYQLTQGFYEEQKPITFSFDFKQWYLSTENKEALEHLKGIAERLRVEDVQKQAMLRTKLDATFAQRYIYGYWETTASQEFGLWFIDYNRILGKMYKDFKDLVQRATSSTILQGQAAYSGIVRGKVCIVREEDIGRTMIEDGDILVCKMTTPAYVPLMKQAAAIITDLGGILSHAAIISRELKKPCITGTKMATTTLKNGDTIEIDAQNGSVRKL